MPLSSDAAINQTSEELVAQFHDIFGKHPGFRATHARGILIKGVFNPSAEAKDLSSAPHFNSPSTPITVRFSNSTGIPEIPDTDPNANPRGIGIRFHLGSDAQGKRVHTDIIAHSTPFFPVRTGQEFLSFLRAIAASPPDAQSPTPIERFLGANPAALAFVQAPKPTPTSFAKAVYYGVNAFRFVNSAGKETYFRYVVTPDLKEENVSENELKTRDPSFLFEELPQRIRQEKPSFTLKAQIAEAGDVVDDATVHWPSDRKLVVLGKIVLEDLVPNGDKEQKNIIYDPIPRVQGIEPSADPLLEMRASVYLISGRQRRNAS